VQQRRAVARERRIVRRERQRAGQPARHFLGERRPRQRAKARFLAERGARYLVGQLARTLLEAFAQPDERRRRAQGAEQRAQAGDRRRREHKLAS